MARLVGPGLGVFLSGEWESLQAFVGGESDAEDEAAVARRCFGGTAGGSWRASEWSHVMSILRPWVDTMPLNRQPFRAAGTWILVWFLAETEVLAIFFPGRHFRATPQDTAY